MHSPLLFSFIPLLSSTLICMFSISSNYPLQFRRGCRHQHIDSLTLEFTHSPVQEPRHRDDQHSVSPLLVHMPLLRPRTSPPQVYRPQRGCTTLPHVARRLARLHTPRLCTVHSILRPCHIDVFLARFNNVRTYSTFCSLLFQNSTDSCLFAPSTIHDPANGLIHLHMVSQYQTDARCVIHFKYAGLQTGRVSGRGTPSRSCRRQGGRELPKM
ncbi:hypothetical protein BC628DRAFT_948966 [Trametes gibbosa]|nr:hypothetical protein BC628DRAFT_948966 [Trametes gibbosa]